MGYGERARRAAPPVVYDRFRRQIQLSDLVFYEAPYQFSFVVQQIKPILDPSQPAGLVEIVLQTTVRTVCRKGGADPSITVVSRPTAEDQQDAERQAAEPPELEYRVSEEEPPDAQSSPEA